MKRGSTTPITITIRGIDLTGAEWLIVSVKRSHKPMLELKDDRLTVTYSDNATTIAFALTQNESLANGESLGLDVNWMIDGVREGVVPRTFSITNTYLEREVR